MLTSLQNPESLTKGFGRIEPASGNPAPAGLAILSYRTGNNLVSETSVSAAVPLRSGRIYAEINGPVDTGLAIANPNSQAANISFYFTDAAGNNLVSVFLSGGVAGSPDPVYDYKINSFVFRAIESPQEHWN